MTPDLSPANYPAEPPAVDLDRLYGDMSLTDYRRAVDLCRAVVAAADDREVTPTVAGSFLGELKVLLGKGSRGELRALQNLITSTADAYAAEHDHVVVLDDVVAQAIAAAVWDRYLGGAA